MQEESLKDKLINKLKDTRDAAILEKVSNILQESQPVYQVNEKQKKSIDESKEQIRNTDTTLQKYLPQIKELMQQHGVQTAYAFGSAVKETMQRDSDVDFIISFPSGIDHETYANKYFNLLNDLRDLLNTDVDLLAKETITNPYLWQSINQHKLKIL